MWYNIQPMELRGIKIRLVLTAAVLAAMAVGFRAMLFSHLPGVFSAAEEDMDYAWFVPLFSIAVLWNERALLRESLGRPGAWGLAAAVPCLLLGLLGARGLQVRFELLAFIGLLISVPWAMFGGRCAKRVAFPALCLLFCMPLASYLSILTVHLRLFASAAAGGILSLLFDGVVRQGNMIALVDVVVDGSPFVIDIANPCSGLRSIFALMAISVGYGYFTQPTWGRRAVLFALSVPLAVLGNITRIITICVVAKSSSPQFATGFYHDFSGFVVFAVALLLLIGAGGALDRLCGAGAKDVPSAEGCDDPKPEAPPPSSGASGIAVPVLAALVVVPVMAFQAMTPEPELSEAPAVVFPDVAGFAAEPLEPSVAETNILRGAAIDKRLYKAAGGMWFQVSAVTSGANKGSLHRPELCLPSQGFDMGDSRSVRIGDVDWRVIPLMAKGDCPDALFAYTFFNQDGYGTDSHEARIWRDVWDRTVYSRIDRWVMLTVQFPSSDMRAFRALLGQMGGFSR